MKQTYETKGGKTVTVEYNENREMFCADWEEETLWDKSLSNLKTRLDRRSSPKLKAAAVDAYYSGGRYGISADAPVMIRCTSVITDGYYKGHARFTFVEGANGSKRESAEAKYILARTPANAQLVEECKSISAEIKALEKKRAATIARMKPADLGALKALSSD